MTTTLIEDRVPDRLPHRSAPIQLLSDALAPAEADATPDNARIFGPSGAGKTTLAKFVLREFSKETDTDLDYQHIDCLQAATPAAIVHRLVMGLEDTAPGEYTLGSTPTAAYFEALREREAPVVAVLDEADNVRETDVISQLHNAPGVAVWVIGHTEESLFSRLDMRAASRLRAGPRVRLEPYSDSQLVDILTTRVPGAVAEDAVTTAALESMADRAAGNARQALWLLRYSLTHAEHTDGVVDVEVVAEVAQQAQVDLRGRNLSRLDTEHRVIYRFLKRDGGELSGSEIHDRLEQRMGQGYDDDARRAFVATLVEYEAVAKHGATRGATYSARALE